MSNLRRSLKRNATPELSDDWGSWTADGLKPAKETESYADAQPREWQDWHSSSNSSFKDDYAGDTGSQSWHHSWWEAPNTWVEPDASAPVAKDVAITTDEWMQALEEDLADKALDTYDGDGDCDVGGAEARIADAMKQMNRRDGKTSEALVEGLELLRQGKLPSNHRSLQKMRRSGGKADPGMSTADLQTFFMETELEALVKTHTYTKTVEKSSGAKSTFLSFDRMVWLEGGSQNPRNVEAVVDICKECIRLGPDFYDKSRFGKRVKYAYEVVSFGAKTKEAWAGKTEGSVKKLEPVGTGGTQAGDKEAGKKAAGELGKNPKPPRERTEAEKALAEALVTKTELSGAELKATRLTDRMTKDKSFAREKSAYYDELTDMLAALEKLKDSDSFYKDFILKDVNDIKHLHGTDTLSSKCAEFAKAFKGPSKQMVAKVKEVLGMVRSREQSQKDLEAGCKPSSAPKKKARKA